MTPPKCCDTGNWVKKVLHFPIACHCEARRAVAISRRDVTNITQLPCVFYFYVKFT